MIKQFSEIEQQLAATSSITWAIDNDKSGLLATWLVKSGYTFTVTSGTTARVVFKIQAKTVTSTLLHATALAAIPVEIDSKIARLNKLLVEAKEEGNTVLRVRYESAEVLQLVKDKLLEAGYKVAPNSYDSQITEIRW